MKKSSNLKLISLILTTLLISACSKNSSSIENSNVPSGNTGFDVTPPSPDDSSSDQEPIGQNPDTDPNNGGSENEYRFILNGGASYTHGQQLEFSLAAPVAIGFMKIGQTADCRDGVVENFKSSFSKPIFKRNAFNTVSIQFISFTGAMGACMVKTILQDDQGPDVLISQYPMTDLQEGSNADLKYTVQDISAVKEVTCSLNNISKPCAAHEGVVKITAMTEGDYTFKVTAKDAFGFSSEKNVSWKVLGSYKKINQLVEIKNDRKVDILMIIDNSVSMEYEQKSMAKRVGNMLSVLKGLDWQIAVTTTDPRNVNLGDGRLIPIYGLNGDLILKSSTLSDTDAQLKLGMTIQRPEQGSALEQPINATYRFIERALGKDSAYRKFFREGSNFAAIVISDEDESDNQFRNDPANLMKLISSSFNQQKVFTWHSIITKPGDQACKKTYGATFGERLAKFSEMTGGLIGSVCEADYAAQMTGIANGIVGMNKKITLTCEALAHHPIVIKKDGQPYTKNFVQEGLNLKFNEVLEPGNYSIDYTCLK